MEKINSSITQQDRNYWNLEGKGGTKVEFLHSSSDSGFGRQRDNCPQLKTQTVARKGRGEEVTSSRGANPPVKLMTMKHIPLDRI